MFTEEQAAAYLAGVIDGEGHVSSRNKFIYIGATDVEMVKASVECCKVLGLHCTEYQPRQYRPGNRQQMHEVRIRTQESLQRILDDVPIQIERKKDALRLALTRFKRSPKPSREWLVWAYEQEGMNGPQIAELTSTTAPRVYRWLRSEGIPVRHSPITTYLKRPEREWLVERFINQGQTVKSIGDELGVAYTTVYKWLDEYAIPRTRQVTQH